MQRVRVGVTGLAAVLLMVAAAAALFESTRDKPAASNGVGIANQTAGNLIDPDAETPNEPLAEIGVAPGAGPTETEKAAASAQVATSPAARPTP